jgi:hypothetical protein
MISMTETPIPQGRPRGLAEGWTRRDEALDRCRSLLSVDRRLLPGWPRGPCIAGRRADRWLVKAQLRWAYLVAKTDDFPLCPRYQCGNSLPCGMIQLMGRRNGYVEKISCGR